MRKVLHAMEFSNLFSIITHVRHSPAEHFSFVILLVLFCLFLWLRVCCTACRITCRGGYTTAILLLYARGIFRPPVGVFFALRMSSLGVFVLLLLLGLPIYFLFFCSFLFFVHLYILRFFAFIFFSLFQCIGVAGVCMLCLS